MSHDPRLPTALSATYELRRAIGAGGMAVVYEAWDAPRARTVAVKVVRPELVSAALIERFQREIALVAKLSHPHIVDVYTSGVEGQTLYFVMPFFAGGTLRDRLRRAAPLPVAEVRRLARELGGALHYAHGLGCIHRDVKPENILFHEGAAKLADFGIARSAESPAAEPGQSTTGGFIGTPTYASPEQLRATAPLSPASDQYALACVLFEALAGRPPFVADSAADVVVAHTTAPPPSVTAYRPDAPPAMDTALRRALAKEPAARFADVAAFVDAFTARTGAAHDAGSAAGTGGGAGAPPRRGRTVALLGVAAAVALAITAALGGFERLQPAGGGPMRIAVLPCDNLTGDATQDYFSDGITDDLIARLSTLPDLRVINLQSTLRYKGTDTPIERIARELDVRMVVTCATNRWPDRVRVSARLVDPATGEYRWTKVYEASSEAVLRDSLDAAVEIAGALGVPVLLDGQPLLNVQYTADDSAFTLYQMARSEWHSGTLRGLYRADGLMYEAAERDPEFSLAWAGRADAKLSLVGRWMHEPRQQYADAEYAINQALAADAGSGAALAARGRLRHRRDWNFSGARADLARARSLSPSTWQPPLDLAKLESVFGRHDQAVLLAEEGMRLNPESAIAALGMAEMLYFARRYDDALRQADRAIRLDTTFAFPHLWRAMILIGAGRPTEAVEAARLASALMLGHPGTLAILARAEAEAGRPDEARRLLREMERSASLYVPQTLVAVVHIGLGERDAAVAALARAVDERDWFISELAVHPLADAVRDDPRVQALLARMGLDRVPAPVSVVAEARDGRAATPPPPASPRSTSPVPTPASAPRATP